MHKHERLAQLIGQRMKPNEALAIVGVSEAYYKRLKDTPEFLELVGSYCNPKTEEQSKHSVVDEANIVEDRWAALEMKTLDAALGQIAGSEMKDINRLLDTLAKRKVGKGMVQAAHKVADNQAKLITLRLPQHTHTQLLAEQVVTTSQGEVVKAGDRDLTPLSTDSVTKLLEAARPKPEEDTQNVDAFVASL